MTAFRYLMMAIGSCLTLCGGLLLLWLGYLVYEIVTRPEDVRLVQFVLEQVSTKLPVISGPPQSGFAIYLSESAQTFGFFILGIFALGVLASIVKALLWGGVAVARAALDEPKAPPPSQDTAESDAET